MLNLFLLMERLSCRIARRRGWIDSRVGKYVTVVDTGWSVFIAQLKSESSYFIMKRILEEPEMEQDIGVINLCGYR